MKKIFILIIVAALGYFGYRHFFAAHGPGGGMMGGAAPVGVAEVIERDVQQWHEFSGRLIAVDSAQIRPRVAGTIEKIHFQEGQWVEKDQPLFTIDQRTYLANLQAAQARATLAEAEIARAKSLLADKAVPQREYDQRKNDADVARAELTRAKLDYDYSIVKAPIAGRVSRAEITVGNLVDAGGNAPILTTVVSNKPIYADFDVDERTFLTYIKSVGSDTQKLNSVPVQLGLASDKDTPYLGTIQSFDNQLTIASGTIRVRAVFANEDGSLVPGLYARIRIGDAQDTHAILVSERAIGTDQSKKFVIVVGAENKTEKREIVPGGMADGLRIVESGLKPGEKIVVSGLQRIMMPGQPVTPEAANIDGTPIGKPDAAPQATAPAEAPAAKETAPAAEAPAPATETPAAEEKPATEVPASEPAATEDSTKEEKPAQ